MFSSKSFIVSVLMFRSLVHFEFIFVDGVRECSDFILSHVAVQFSQHHLLKKLSFLHILNISKVYSCLLCQRQGAHILAQLYVLSCWSIFLFLCQYHAVLVTVALYYSLKSESLLHFSVSGLLCLFRVFCVSI